MNKRKQLYKNRRILLTLAVMLLIAATSLIAMFHINDIAEESCWNSLYDTAEVLEDEIDNKLKMERMHLEMVAEALAKYEQEQTEEMLQVLQAHQHGGKYTIQHMGILFPDNTVFLADKGFVSAKGKMSFAEEAAKGAHVTDRTYSLSDPDKMVIRNFVPIVKNGRTAAMLYSVNDLANQAKDWEINAYDGNVAAYIIDTKTGDFIVDTWHKELGNISALGDRATKPGYESDSLQKNMLRGKTGYVVFLSKTIGDYLYFYYTPLDINEWSLGVSVPEKLVFERAERIRSTLYMLGVFEFVCFIAYFVWLLADTKRENQKKQRQLEEVNHVYTVQRILFRAHHDSDAIVSALEQVAKVHGAALASFEVMSEDGNGELYTWSSDEALQERVLDSYRSKKYLKERFAAKMEPAVVADVECCRCKEENQAKYRHLKELQIYNLMEVPVFDAEENLVGILGVFNIEPMGETTVLLEGVSLSFGMIYSNMQLFDKIRKMGIIDFLTGLKNRNSYENEMAGYWQNGTGSLACVYIDADGLHELNNTLGHAAGDEMLCCIAEAVRSALGEEGSYRTGGDEFVAFAAEESENEVRDKVETVRKEIFAAGYHASIGMHWAAKVETAEEMDTLIKAAEQEMYREKETYHETAKLERRF